MVRENVIGKFQLYYDLGADVRYSNSKVPIRQLITPDDPDVMELAGILHEDPNFIDACQDFVHQFTKFAHEPGDYWAMPVETLDYRSGDCDCLSILLCSLLRVYLPPEQVYCAVGLWSVGGKSEGHMFILVDQDGEDRIVESTAAPDMPLVGTYQIYCIFNDKFCFASKIGLETFDLTPVLV